jgi:hypothetical protein
LPYSSVCTRFKTQTIITKAEKSVAAPGKSESVYFWLGSFEIKTILDESHHKLL